MIKRPSLLDLIKMVPAAELARAANSLGLGPEALTKRILQLDTRLGTRLVDTATRALKPGEAGRLVIEHATRIFSQARDLTRDLEELAGLQAPELHFGTDMFAAELPLGEVLGRMASANPRLRVHAETSNFDNLSREVSAGRLEFAVADTSGAERHPSRMAIEPVAEHRVFLFVREAHPLTTAVEHSLEAILDFPLAAPRLPQRLAGHLGKAATYARVDRESGDLTPSLMLDSFSVARNAVLAGNAVGLAPLVALEADLRAKRIVLLPYTAPWMHLSYGLFYPRKRSLSRVAQLFMTQLRRVETTIQARAQRALSRFETQGKPRRGSGGRARTRPPGAATRTTGRTTSSSSARASKAARSRARK
jgi:DNA-binding transcriptional LysR family regulator